MNPVKIMLILWITAFLTAGCTTTKSVSGGRPPSWVEDVGKTYPPEKYLAVVGEGDSQKAAKNNAAGNLAQIFRTRIVVDSTIQTRYNEIAGAEGEILEITSQTLVDETIGQSANEDLLNLQFGEMWFSDMGKVYAAAYLDRAKTGLLYRQRIQEKEARIIELLDRAREQEDPLRRFAFLEAAAIVAEANHIRIQQLDIINAPMSRSLLLGYERGEILAAAADQGKALKINIEVSGDRENRLLDLMRGWSTKRGFSVSANGDMPFNGVVAVEKVELKNDYENFSWYISLNLLDTQGYPAVTLERKGRSSGISPSAAESRAYLDVAEVLTKEFNRAFDVYLADFVEK